MEEITRQVSFDYTLQPLEGLEVAEICPLTGKIKTVTASCLGGGDNLVLIAFGHGATKLCPTNGYLPLHGNLPPFTGLEEPVKMNERLWCEIHNGDDTYPHRVTVTAIVVGRYGGGIGKG